MKKTSEFTGKSSKMKGKYQKKKENTWETPKTKKIPKKNKKNSKINLAPLLLGFCSCDGLLPSAQGKGDVIAACQAVAALQVIDKITKVTAHQVDLHHLEKILF